MRKRPLGLLIELGSAVVVVVVVAAVVPIAVSRASDPGMPGTPDLGSYQIVPPAQLNGATLVTQPGVASAYAADSVNAGFLTPALWNGDPTPFGGVYASSGSVQPQFIFFGAYGALSDPGGAESGAWQALSGDGGTYTDLAAYPPGSPGGASSAPRQQCTASSSPCASGQITAAWASYRLPTPQSARPQTPPH